jgi:hypothetical protein
LVFLNRLPPDASFSRRKCGFSSRLFADGPFGRLTFSITFNTGQVSNLPRNSIHASARECVSRMPPLPARDFFFFSPIR